MANKVRPGIRFGQAIGLTVFSVSALFLGALGFTALSSGPIGVRGATLVVSTFGAAVACLAMLADGFDLWVLKRRMTPFSVRMTHSLVFVTVLASLGLSIIGRNTLLFVLMAPALIAYLFTVIKPPPAATYGGGRAQGGERQGGSRQRRGGRRRS